MNSRTLIVAGKHGREYRRDLLERTDLRISSGVPDNWSLDIGDGDGDRDVDVDGADGDGDGDGARTDSKGAGGEVGTDDCDDVARPLDEEHEDK